MPLIRNVLQGMLRRLRARGVQTAIACATALTIAVLWLAAYRVIEDRKAEAFARARDQVQREVGVLALQWSQVLRHIGQLGSIGERLTRAVQSGDRAAAADIRKELLHAIQLVGDNDIAQVSAAGLDGLVMWSSETDDPGRVDLSDRAHIQAILKQGRERFISEPVLGRVSHEWTVQFTRPALDASGKLAGVIVVSYRSAAAGRFLEHLNLGSHAAFGIWRDEGSALGISQGGALSSQLRSRFAGTCQGPVASTIAFERGPSGVDGTMRIYARECVAGTGTMVSVGLDEAEAMAPVRHAARAIWWMAGFSSVLTLAAGLMLLRWQRGLAERIALAADRALFHDLSGNIGDTLIKSAADGTVEYVSPAIHRLLGIRPEDVTGNRLGDFVHPAGRADHDRHMSAIASGTGAASSEYRFRHRNGQPVWVDVHSTRAAPEGGGPPMHYSVLRDVTQKHATLAALAEARLALEAAVDAGPGALFRLRMTPGQPPAVRYVSAAIERITGYSPQDAMAQGWLGAIIDPEFASAAAALLTGLLAFQPGDLQFRYRTKGGAWRWMQATVRPQQPAPGGGVDAVLYALDITAQKEQQARLIHTAKLATLGEMTTSLAHELNQPLATISMAAENAIAELEESGNIPPTIVRLNRIHRQALRAADLIDKLRVFGRKDSGSMMAVDLPGLMSNVSALATPRLRFVSASLVIELSADLPRIDGNPMLLEQVLVNLIANACDAYETATPPVPQDHRTITVSAQPCGSRVIVKVADHAGGVPPDIAGRIFEPFFTTKPASKGTGVGLSFSHGVIAEMGGTLSVSNQDGGAVFEISLPVYEGPPGAERHGAEPAAAA